MILIFFKSIFSKFCNLCNKNILQFSGIFLYNKNLFVIIAKNLIIRCAHSDSNYNIVGVTIKLELPLIPRHIKNRWCRLTFVSSRKTPKKNPVKCPVGGLAGKNHALFVKARGDALSKKSIVIHPRGHKMWKKKPHDRGGKEAHRG